MSDLRYCHMPRRTLRAYVPLSLSIVAILLAFAMPALTPAQTSAAQEGAGVVMREAQQKKRGKSTLRGRVLFADDDRPVRRARVILTDPSDRSSSRHGATDSRGDFVIRDVAAGTYYVMVDAPSVVSMNSFFDLDDDGTGGNLALERMKDRLTQVTVDGTSNTETKVRAERGGVITGKVRYADGDPAIGTHIQISRKRGARIVPYLSVLGNQSVGLVTDDRGIYRVAGLPAGEYIVSAAEEEPESGIDEERQIYRQSEQATLAATFHPAATSAVAATPVSVTAGKEVSDIDIKLVERRTFRLAGTVVARRDAQPLSQATVSIASKDDAAGALARYFGRGQMTSTDAQGRWSFASVPAGTYVVTIETRFFANLRDDAQGGSPPRRSYVSKQQEVTVSDADVTDARIEVSEGMSLAGVVTIEGSKPLPRGVFVSVRAANGEQASMMRPQGFMRPDGRWSMDGVAAGEVRLSVSTDPQSGYYVKAITAGERNLLREPLRIEEGGEISDIRIVLSGEVAMLAGRVLAKGVAPGGGVVALVPADIDERRLRDPLIGGTNAAGAFNVSGAPGDYLVFVLRPDQASGKLDEEYVRAHAAEAQRITLKAGERRTLDISVP